MGDTLFVGNIHNKALPLNMTEEKAKTLISLFNKIVLYPLSIPARNCYRTRDPIREIKDFFENKINNNNKQKYILLTLHDADISHMLHFLNYPITHIPKYNANIKFELLKINNKFFVRTKFDQKIIKICKKELCSFGEFRNLIAKNIENQCNDFKLNQKYLEQIGVVSNESKR